MRTFVLKSLLLLMLILVSSLLILLYNPRERTFDDTHYMAAMIDKHKRLESLSPPRLIFIGGSNLAFGIDSQRIEKEIGIPTVNMSLHASLGMPFMLNEIEPSIKKGDVIIMSFEYSTDHLLKGDKDFQRHTVQMFPKAQLFLESTFAWPSSVRPIVGYMASLIETIETCVEQIQQTAAHGRRTQAAENTQDNKNKSPYRRGAFSEHGDVIAHLDLEPAKELPIVRQIGSRDYVAFIRRINRFAETAKSRGASVYFMFPPYPLSEFMPNQREIRKYQDACIAKLNIEILNTPEMFAFPDNYFHDTVYHLRKAGRDLRTSMTLELLKKKLEKHL